MTKPKNPQEYLPRGRPTEYRPEYCEVVERLGELGKSKTQIASVLDVNTKTIDEWALKWPEFAESIARARELAMTWWEDVGQAGLTDKFFNAQLWSRSMAARFPDQYREAKDLKLTVESDVSQRLIAGRKRIGG